MSTKKTIFDLAANDVIYAISDYLVKTKRVERIDASTTVRVTVQNNLDMEVTVIETLKFETSTKRWTGCACVNGCKNAECDKL